MHQKDMERFAFLYLCGQRDRELLAGTERMTFEDFDRLAYITDFLGLDQMNLEIWNQFSPQFRGQFQAIERVLEETCGDRVRLVQFCADAPDLESQEYLAEVMDLLMEDRNEKMAGQAEEPEKE